MSARKRMPRKQKHVRMNGVSVSGSGEWSDDAVKSGSNTGFSDPENEEGTTRRGDKHFIKKYDPYNAVLDKIDAELSSMKSGSQPSTKGDKSQSSDFDELTRSQLAKPDNTERYRKVLEPPSSGLDISRGRHIIGTAEIYSDAAGGTDAEERTNAPSDLDSLSAQQVDEKFKEIMRKKRGNYLDNLRASYPQSDTDTIRTEDFEKTFRNAMVYNSDDSSTLVLSDEDRLDDSFDESLPPPPSCVVDPPPNTGSRLSAVAEEPDSTTKPKLSLQTKTLAAAHPAVPVVPQTERSSRSRKRRTPQASDAESVKTEDFEIRFQDLMVQPTQNGRDSGQDSEPVDPLHRKVREILRVSAPYKTKSRNGYHRNKAESEERRQKYIYGLKSTLSEKKSTLSEKKCSDLKDIDVPARPRLYGCSLEYNEEKELDFLQKHLESNMSSSSSAGTGTSSLSSGYTFNSGRGTPERPLSESRTTSVSSLRSDLSELTASPAASPQIRLRNPFLEKILVDSATLQGMNLMTTVQDGPWKKQPWDRQIEPKKNFNTSKSKSKMRDLILPEEDQDEYPFAKYTFNKKPGKMTSSSSEISIGSKDSSLSPWDSPNSGRHNFYNRHGSSTSSQLSEDYSSPETGTSSGSFNTSFSSKQSNFGTYPSSPDVCYSTPVYPQSFQSYNVPPSTGVMFSQQSVNEPDQILYNLGFAEKPENFLPERFAQDWYKKIQQSKINQVKQQLERLQMECQASEYSGMENMNMLSSGQTTPQWKSQAELWQNCRIKNLGSQVQRQGSKRSIFHQDEKKNLEGKVTERQLSVSKLYDLLKRENQQFLKEYDSTTAKDLRRKQFASHRQKSLPTYLETLTEEDENRPKYGIRKASKMEKVVEAHAESSSSEEKSLRSLSQDVNSDLSMSDSGSSTQELQDNSIQSQTQIKRIVPSIMICQSPVKDYMESKDSIEVANILSSGSEDDSSNTNYKAELHLEPAMLSMVLQDAESARSNQLLTVMRPNGNGEYSEDRLHPASPSSASSVSPCPLSPVTVIEVNLDNQNDSIDTEEGGNSNQSTNNSMEKDSGPGDSQTSVSSSGGKKIKEATSSSMRNVSKFQTSLESDLNSVNAVLSSLHNASTQPNSQGLCEAFIQTEDITLSPLLSFSDFDGFLKKILNGENEHFYVAEDKEIQCDMNREKNFFTFLTQNSVDTTELASVPQSRRTSVTFASPVASIVEKSNSCSSQDSSSCVSTEVQTDEDYSCTCGVRRRNSGEQSSGKSFLGLTEGSYNVKNEANFSRIFSSSFCDSVSEEQMNGRIQNKCLSPDSSKYTPLEVTLDRLESKAQHWKTVISQKH